MNNRNLILPSGAEKEPSGRYQSLVCRVKGFGFHVAVTQAGGFSSVLHSTDYISTQCAQRIRSFLLRESDASGTFDSALRQTSIIHVPGKR